MALTFAFAVAFFVHVGVQGTGHRRTEARKVRTTVTLWNVVGEAVDVFRNRRSTAEPLPRRYRLFRREIEDIWVNWRFVLVQVFNERFDTTFIVEVVFFVVAFVTQTN